jgi:hypothetical protein
MGATLPARIRRLLVAHSATVAAVAAVVAVAAVAAVAVKEA